MHSEIQKIVEIAADEAGVDSKLLRAMVLAESAGRAGAYRFEPAYWDQYCATNSFYRHRDPRRVAASYGLMQVMYPTAVLEGFEGEPEELFVPMTSLYYGIKHLQRWLRRWDHDLPKALASYNGGLKGPMRPKPRAYAQKVLDLMAEL